MPRREDVLDGLAWAGITEKARIARISNMLVKELGSPDRNHTLTRVREAVRATAPPYGRGKIITEAVGQEYKRQLPIHCERQDKHEKWQAYLDNEAKLSTRINRAYAFRFGRPMYEPHRQYDGDWCDWEYRRAWDEEEDKRDKGDNCIALTHQGEHTVCLVLSGDNVDIPHIATIAPGEDVVRTYLHCTYHNQPGNLVEAAVMLGGPKVRAALSLGKKVVTDWVGRRTFIHHEGQDHVHPHVEELPWQAATIKTTPGRWGDEIEVIPATVHGDSVEVVGE